MAKELARYSVIENVITGYLKVDEAAEQLHLCRRQVFRLKKKLKEEGIEGLIHGNRGRASPRRIPEGVRDLIDLLYKGKYTGFNISHFTEMLEGRGPKIKLIGGIDNATKDVPHAKFAYQDSVEENMATFKKIVKKKGIPLSLYVDKDSKYITTRHGGRSHTF